MKLIILVAFVLNSVLAYHDPDLNYHLSQVQKISDCENGYSYETPSVQLTTASEKRLSAPATSFFSQSIEAAPAYQYLGTDEYSTSESARYSANGNIEYSNGITYQPVPKITYATQPVVDYRTSSKTSDYARGYATKEVHGYATSAGLSSTGKGSIISLPTYAQAPIIAKVTAAPLIVRFSVAPSKNSFVTQNSISQSAFGSSAKASLNTYDSTQRGGPVVTQLFAARSAGYATHPALKVQQSAQVVAPAVQYNNAPVTTYTQSAPAVQYTSSVNHVSAPTRYFSPGASYKGSSVTRYSTPAVQYSAPTVQYSAPTIQYSAPAVQYSSPAVHYSAPAVQYSAPAVQYSASAAQYSAPAVQYSAPSVQYSTPAVQYSAPAVQYSTPAVAQYAAYSAPTLIRHTVPALKRYSTPAVTSVGQYANVPITHISSSLTVPTTKKYKSHAVKNVHSEFLENYDAHPRYAFEYNVHDPHTGDIKQQKEERDGEVVKGQYSLVEPDGSVRTVDYVADWETGFHADVRNSKDNAH